ncbi:hypothetical protein E2C01_098902 [Portunus trituberculatus]|uniref:Uncharacterized protein n=1 Tax=Portunus trituberculatus TaxID=210409 RepID=A0A5B7K440_PORTR|nr:hypothetical protein [Portunus trituberculatus]
MVPVPVLLLHHSVVFWMPSTLMAGPWVSPSTAAPCPCYSKDTWKEPQI